MFPYFFSIFDVLITLSLALFFVQVEKKHHNTGIDCHGDDC